MPSFDEQKKVDEVIEKLNKDDEFSEIGKYRESSVKDASQLFCFGCAHEAAGKPFPGIPSGERPCFFCVRNVEREKWQQDFKKRHGHELKEWYNGSPIAFYPMDVYQPLDMIEQHDRWERKAKGDPDWNIPRGGIRFG